MHKKPSSPSSALMSLGPPSSLHCQNWQFQTFQRRLFPINEQMHPEGTMKILLQRVPGNKKFVPILNMFLRGGHSLWKCHIKEDINRQIFVGSPCSFTEYTRGCQWCGTFIDLFSARPWIGHGACTYGVMGLLAAWGAVYVVETTWTLQWRHHSTSNLARYEVFADINSQKAWNSNTNWTKF